MKLGKLLLPLLLSLAVLSACGGAPMDAAQNTAYPASSGGASADTGGGDYWGETETALTEPMEQPEAADTAMPQESEKIIYSADMELETKEFEAACTALDQAVASLGGRYERRSLNQGGSYRYLSCTVRVPTERFREFLDLAGQSAHVTYRNEYTENVGEAYYDSEARLATQRTKLERLQNLLAQAAGMEDIIRLEEALSETELQIEYLTGDLRRYDSLIDYSTVTINLQEVYRLSTDEELPMTFGQRLSAALGSGLRRGVEGFEEFIIAIACNWVAILVLAALAAAVWAVLRRRKKRRTPPPSDKE